MAPSHSFRICDRPRIVTRSEQRQGIESLLSEASKSLEKYGFEPQEACHTTDPKKTKRRTEAGTGMWFAQMHLMAGQDGVWLSEGNCIEGSKSRNGKGRRSALSLQPNLEA